MDTAGTASRRSLIAGVALRLGVAGAVVLLLGLSPVPGRLVESVEQGRAVLSAGDSGEAAALFRVAAAYEPWVDRHLAAAARAELEAGRYVQANALLDELAARRPLSAEEMLWRGVAYDGQGQHEQALAVWEQAWAAGSVSEASIEALAAAYLDAGEFEMARLALEELARLDTVKADVLVRLAMLQALDDTEAASATLHRAVTLGYPETQLEPLSGALAQAVDDPRELQLHRLGVALLEIGERQLAAEAFDRAVRSNPAYAEPLAYLAYTQALLDQPSLGAMQQALSLAPESARVHALAGLTWREIGRPAEARADLERALALDPSNPALAVEIASTHRAERQLISAEAWMREAVKLSQGDLTFRRLLAEFYVDEGYRVGDQGLPLLMTLAEQAPGDAEIRAALGWAHFLVGDVEAAFTHVDEALQLDENSVRANAHKAALLDSQGRLDEAAVYYRRALELDPDGPFGALARRALERIGARIP